MTNLQNWSMPAEQLDLALGTFRDGFFQAMAWISF